MVHGTDSASICKWKACCFPGWDSICFDAFSGLEVAVKILYEVRMSFRNIIFGFSLLVVLFALPALSGAQNARFLNLIDGDSMLVEYGGYSQEVRLIGIDAPEWGQEYGTQARAHAMNFCFGQGLRLEFDKEKKDRYGRILAYVYCGDRMLNEEMVRAGMAIVIKIKPNTKYYDRLKNAETKARAERRGFWLRGGLKETPGEWRKRNK